VLMSALGGPRRLGPSYRRQTFRTVLVAYHGSIRY
jgi:hypothetical protein